MRSFCNSLNARRWSLSVSVSLALAAGAALADETKATSQSPGLMTFPNVRVENAPQAAAASTTVAASGMRAAMDPATGRLRQMTAEDAKQLDAAKAKASTTRTRTATLSSETSEAPLNEITGVDGSPGVDLTDEHMVFQVARKQGDQVVRSEYTGKAATEKALNATEVSHDR